MIWMETEGYRKIFAGGGVWCLIGGWKSFKKGRLDKGGGEKIEKGLYKKIIASVCVCVCVCLFYILFFPREGKTFALSSEYKTTQAEFKDWMSFLTFNIMEEINLNPESLNANT